MARASDQTMDKLPQLNTAYALPFEFIRTRGHVLSTGGVVRIALRLSRVSPIAIAAAEHTLASFIALAETGALAGDTIMPGASRAPLRVYTSSDAGEVVAEGICHVDERAALVLAHMLLKVQPELELLSLSLLAPGSQGSERVPHDPTEDTTYPTLPRKLPFELSDSEPEGGGALFQAEFLTDVVDGTRTMFEQAANAWHQAILSGAYALAPISPSESYVEPDSVVVFDNILEWPVFKIRAADEALSAVVSMFAALHERHQKLRSVSIE
jgi:hypothetical protein